MRVVFLILDALAPRRLGRRLTPTLCRWASSPGGGVRTGVSVMASCTYPNHATFATGVPPSTHRIFINHVVKDGKVLGAWEVGPEAPTIFEACRRGGARSEAVLGDHHLVGVMGARAATSHWPEQGTLPEGIALDPLGYPHDDEVLQRLCAAIELGADLVVGYFGSLDTTSHLFGPDSEEALQSCRDLDRRLEEVDHALATGWDDTVLIVVSDHDQEPALDLSPIDLREHGARRGVEAVVCDEGSAALVSGPRDTSWLAGCPGVAGWELVSPGSALVWGEVGRCFGSTASPIFRGIHGGTRTRDQLALISGGHPAVPSVLASLGQTPEATLWARLIASLLLVSLEPSTPR